MSRKFVRLKNILWQTFLSPIKDQLKTSGIKHDASMNFIQDI